MHLITKMARRRRRPERVGHVKSSDVRESEHDDLFPSVDQIRKEGFGEPRLAASRGPFDQTALVAPDGFMWVHEVPAPWLHDDFVWLSSWNAVDTA